MAWLTALGRLLLVCVGVACLVAAACYGDAEPAVFGALCIAGAIALPDLQ
jgi:hypothetical protein